MRPFLVAAVLATILLLATSVRGFDPRGPEPFAEVLATTVRVDTPTAGGSGVIVAAGKRRLVVTCAHVTQAERVVSVERFRLGPSRLEVAAVGTGALAAVDPVLDLAAFDVPHDWPAARTSPRAEPMAYDRVLLSGCPGGTPPEVTEGRLADRMDLRRCRAMLRITCPSTPGFSGGPVCAEDGLVVGLMELGQSVMGHPYEHSSLAVPWDEVNRWLARNGICLTR